MKKFVVLMLVLGMASLASATIIMDVQAEANTNEDFTVTISGVASGIAPGMYFDIGLYGDGAALITSNAITAAAGASGAVAPYDPVWLGYELTVGEAVDDTLPGNDPSDGLWITFTGSSAVEGTYTFELWDYAVSLSAPTATGSINIVPEPMTMVLLGLGGLFLRRRK